MLKRERLFFWLAYLRGRVPWDTNVTPPELVQTIEGPAALSPGRAIDLGCGTGTNVIYLAQHGWDAVGVDFVTKAVRQARKKAQKLGMAVQFHNGDVTQLEKIPSLGGPFDLALDIGCLHNLTAEQRTRYATSLIRQLRPGATYLLYAWEPCSTDKTGRGVDIDQVKEMFSPQLHVTRVLSGQDRNRPSAWYWLEVSMQE